MPWPIYGNMTDHDIRAIYEYLKAIPCIQGNYPGPVVSGPVTGKQRSRPYGIRHERLPVNWTRTPLIRQVEGDHQSESLL